MEQQPRVTYIIRGPQADGPARILEARKHKNTPGYASFREINRVAGEGSEANKEAPVTTRTTQSGPNRLKYWLQPDYIAMKDAVWANPGRGTKWLTNWLSGHMPDAPSESKVGYLLTRYRDEMGIRAAGKARLTTYWPGGPHGAVAAQEERIGTFEAAKQEAAAAADSPASDDPFAATRTELSDIETKAYAVLETIENLRCVLDNGLKDELKALEDRAAQIRKMIGGSAI